MSSRALVASAWTVVILTLCLVPSDWLPVAEARLSSSHFLQSRDKLVHSGMFAILSVLWMRVRPTGGGTVLVSVSGLALAILTEWGQGLPMIGRTPDRLDALADAVGTFVGVGVFWALRGLAVASPPAEPKRYSTPEY